MLVQFYKYFWALLWAGRCARHCHITKVMSSQPPREVGSVTCIFRKSFEAHGGTTTGQNHLPRGWQDWDFDMDLPTLRSPLLPSARSRQLHGSWSHWRPPVEQRIPEVQLDANVVTFQDLRINLRINYQFRAGGLSAHRSCWAWRIDWSICLLFAEDIDCCRFVANSSWKHWLWLLLSCVHLPKATATVRFFLALLSITLPLFSSLPSRVFWRGGVWAGVKPEFLSS